MATVESPKKKRHQQTAKDFSRWIATNSDASLKRKVEAFNSIADSNYRKRKIIKKAVKRI